MRYSDWFIYDIARTYVEIYWTNNHASIFILFHINCYKINSFILSINATIYLKILYMYKYKVLSYIFCYFVIHSWCIYLISTRVDVNLSKAKALPCHKVMNYCLSSVPHNKNPAIIIQGRLHKFKVVNKKFLLYDILK